MLFQLTKVAALVMGLFNKWDIYQLDLLQDGVFLVAIRNAHSHQLTNQLKFDAFLLKFKCVISMGLCLESFMLALS